MIKYNFFDNQTIGVDQLNGIIKKFYPLPGVADPLTSGQPYYAGVVNKIVGDALVRGVVPEAEQGLKVSRTDSGEYSVASGAAIFGNGQTAELTEPETVTVAQGRRNYIYIVADVAQNKAYLTAATSPAADKEGVAYYVPLATVDADGNVTDARIYATAAGATYNAAKHLAITVTMDDYLTANRNGYYEGKFSVDYNLGGSEYNMLLMRPGETSLTLMWKTGGEWKYQCLACGSSNNRIKYDDRAIWHTHYGWHTCTVATNGNTLTINYVAGGVGYAKPTFDLWALVTK